MRLTLSAAAVLAALALPLVAQDTTEAGEATPDATEPLLEVSAETVVATVNGTDITLGELIVARQRLGPQFDAMPADQLFQGLLQQAIEQQLFADTLEEQPARVDYALSNERRSLRAGEAITIFLDAAVSDEAIDAKYAEFTEGFVPSTEWNASHILVETEEEAAAVLAELEGGADFATTAAARSIGPSGPNGGALGWFAPGMMVAPFEAAVAELEVGALSAPVQTQFGWHIVKLNDLRESPVPSREELYPDLVRSVQEDAFLSEIEALREAAEITELEAGAINPQVLGDLTLLEP